MKLSTDRILTTHVGSLPRPPAVAETLLARERGEAVAAGEFERVIGAAVADMVRRQIATGIDVVSDGELGKIGYSTYVKDRLTGFSGEAVPKPNLDVAPYPDFRRRMALFTGPQGFKRLLCTGPVAVKDRAAGAAEIARFAAACEAARPVEGFLNAASPGVVASFQPNRFYPSHEAYVEAVAAAMEEEYEAIVAAGFLLQVDCPDLAMSRHTGFQDLTEAEFLKRAAHHVEVLNHALRNIPADRLRLHICWGNYEGPHDHDIALEKILAILLVAKPQAIAFEAANPRHAHEWAVWREAKLRDDKVLIPGVIDSCSNYVEHPELVAQRLAQFTAIVGRERVLAGTDCGFGTFAGTGKVDPEIAFKKLAALAAGAELASRRLHV